MFIVCILFIHSMVTVCTLYNIMYPILLLNFEKPGALMPLFVISYGAWESHTYPKTCEFYLIPHMMTSVAWKQIYSRFSKQLGFFQLENSIRFVLLKFDLLNFLSMAFSHLLYILAHDFFPQGYMKVPIIQQPQKV